MAGPYPCDICQANQAAVILGMIDTGDQQFLCPPCFGRLSLDMAKELLTPEEIAGQLGPMFVQGGRPEPEPAKRPRKRPQAAQEATEPAPGPETPPALEEGQAAAPDG